MPLKEYARKRDFRKTPEPKGGTARGKSNSFVIQKHDARRLHFDLRLEHKGVLKSWAVPKGLPPAGEKHLAVQTEDHPLSYASFRGIIPEGEYGAGTVELWDRGRYDILGRSMEESLRKGHIAFRLAGTTASGTFSLIRMKGGDWLLIRKQEDMAQQPAIEITNPGKKLFRAFTKKEFVEYYAAAAPYMLPHLQDRPLSMLRFPDGVRGEKFFQKNVPEYFPPWIGRVGVMHKSRKTTYALCNDARTLLYLANQVFEFHPWLSTRHALTRPDRMIFDLDPDSFAHARDGALLLRSVLTDIGIVPYVMTTGGRGVHVVVPLDGKLPFSKVASFARTVARHLEREDSALFTAEQRKEKRRAHVFVDTYRNAHGQTAVAPYSIRARENATVAMPIDWKDLRKAEPAHFTLATVPSLLKKRGDAWANIGKNAHSLRDVLRRK